MRVFRLPVGLLALAILFIRASAGSAAPPRETEVGSEEERLRRPREIELPPRPEPGLEIPPEAPPAVPEAPGPAIEVKRIVVEGSTLLSDQAIASLTGSVAGRRVTLAELREIALGVTRWYRARGYLTSKAVVPAQTVEDGVVRIRVLEGKRGELKITGNRFFSSDLLSRQIPVAQGEILRLADLETALGRINAHPDRKGKLILAPGAKPETTDLILQVTDSKPLHANYSIDTLGTKTTGEFRQSLTWSHGNLTGRDDQMAVRGVITESGGLQGGTVSYLRPFYPSGWTGTFDVSGVKSSVGGDLKNLLARGDALTVSPGLIIPWIKRTGLELELVTGFDVRRIRTQLDERTSSKEDLRVARLGTNFFRQDPGGRSLLLQELRVGIPNLLGGSHPEDPAASRARSGGSFVKWTMGLVRVQQGPWGSSLVLRGSGQVATDRLAPAEQLRLGGFETVRGYPEGEYLADAGFQATVELRASMEKVLPGAASRLPLLDRLRRSLLVLAFWDFAEGFVRDPAATEDADARLAGAGFGLRLRPTRESVLQLDFGWAFGDRDSEKDRPRIHLICRVGF